MPTIGWVAQCRLVLHDSVYYSTREVGRLFETGRYLHNWALTYALGLAASDWRAGWWWCWRCATTWWPASSTSTACARRPTMPTL